MDCIDREILKLLSVDAAASSTEIGKKVGLSVPAVNKRIAKLQSGGIIRSFVAVTDPKKVGKPVVAFIFLVVQYGVGVRDLLECVEQDPDVLECYAVTGDYDYIIKIAAESVEALEEKLLFFKRQNSVIKSHTMLSLMEHKFCPSCLPCEENKR